MSYAGNAFLKGDVDGNGVVDIKDVSMEAKHFGVNNLADYGFPATMFNPDLDINKDGTINMIDVGTVSHAFGNRSDWHLVNYDWEIINQTQYWAAFKMYPDYSAVTFDNKGHGYSYLTPMPEIVMNVVGLHQGSMPFWGNSNYVYPFVSENKAMIINSSVMIDHEQIAEFFGIPAGQCSLLLDIWFDVTDQNHTGSVAISIFFDQRGQNTMPLGGWTYTEEHKDTFTWLDFQYRLGQMEDRIWYQWYVGVNDFIPMMKHNIPTSMPDWRWVANAVFSERHCCLHDCVRP